MTYEHSPAGRPTKALFLIMGIGMRLVASLDQQLGQCSIAILDVNEISGQTAHCDVENWCVVITSATSVFRASRGDVLSLSAGSIPSMA